MFPWVTKVKKSIPTFILKIHNRWVKESNSVFDIEWRESAIISKISTGIAKSPLFCLGMLIIVLLLWRKKECLSHHFMQSRLIYVFPLPLQPLLNTNILHNEWFFTKVNVYMHATYCLINCNHSYNVALYKNIKQSCFFLQKSTKRHNYFKLT